LTHYLERKGREYREIIEERKYLKGVTDKTLAW
jgi:hypothetical protein